MSCTADDILVIAKANELVGILKSPGIDIVSDSQRVKLIEISYLLDSLHEITTDDELDAIKANSLYKTKDGIELPEIMHEWYRSWGVLESYWDAYKTVLSEDQHQTYRMYQQSSPNTKAIMLQDAVVQCMVDLVNHAQEQLRITNYKIDKYLSMFYDMSPKNPRLQGEVAYGQ